MADKKKTVTLAGQKFDIVVPLTLGQIIDCRVATLIPTTGDIKEDFVATYHRSLDIIIAGLKVDNPAQTWTREALMAMRITESELNEAQAIVLRESGLVKAKGDGAGEAVAEA